MHLICWYSRQGQKRSKRACAAGYKLALYLIFVHFRTFLEGHFVKYHFAVTPEQRVQVNDQDKPT